MFKGCSGLTTLNISGFDTGKVERMGSMFESCSSLQQVDISHFTAGSLKYIDGIFKQCEKLTKAYVNQSFYDRAHSDKMKNNQDMFKDSALTDFTVK